MTKLRDARKTGDKDRKPKLSKETIKNLSPDSRARNVKGGRLGDPTTSTGSAYVCCQKLTP